MEDKKTLATYNIQNGSTVHMFVSSTGVVSIGSGWIGNFDTLCRPMVGQTVAGLSAFNAVLYVVVSNCIGVFLTITHYIRHCQFSVVLYS